jgi:peptidoglycan/LPS O-acetylase OafA/YrhL
VEVLTVGNRRADAAPPPVRQGVFYHPELDGLRFFAFLMVFVAHSNYNVFDPRWANHQVLANLCYAIHGAGFSGVALFFTLSAYLITELLLREQDQTGAVHLRAFYLRRILRVWPLYFFFLLVVRPLAGLALPWEHFTGGDYAAFLLLAGNWICVAASWPASVATPLWSISIEEQFYLVWPWLVGRMRRRIPLIAAGMLVAANVARVVIVVVDPHDRTGIWCNTFARMDPFALGILLAYWLHGREPRLRGLTRVLLGAGAAAILLAAGRWGTHWDAPALWSYPAESVACVMALAATLRPMGSWQPGGAGRALVYGGRISYGLYVYHLMMLKLMIRAGLAFWPGKLAALAATVAIAALSYKLLESPFLRLKQRVTYVPSRF